MLTVQVNLTALTVKDVSLSLSLEYQPVNELAETVKGVEQIDLQSRCLVI